MANSKLKLIYFDFPGRAEIMRLMLNLNCKEFEDFRLDMETEWPQFKPSTPFGLLPLLEIDGKVYAQSLAIASFLAREFDLYGKTNLDQLKIDQTGQLWDEFIVVHYDRLFREPEVNHAEIHRSLKEEQVPRYLSYFEKFLEENGTGYVVGDNLSLADIIVFDFVTGHFKTLMEDILDRYPLVKALVKKVGNIDRIKAYVAKRK